MPHSPELVQVAMAERQRDADDIHLAEHVRRLAACCAPASLWSRLADAASRAGDICCPTEPERIVRARGIVGI